MANNRQYSAASLKSISSGSKSLIASSGNNNKYQQDPRIWKITRDSKTGSGNALIRFLPSLEAGKLPWVQTFDYFLKSPSGRWYVNNSRRTIGEADPMREYIHEQFVKAGNDEVQKKYLRETLRERMQYVCNILVLKDPGNPAYEGKVMLFKFGKTIMDKILAKSQDELGDSCNPFDWVEGCDFKLRLKAPSGRGVPNYDSSEFTNSTPIADDMIEKIANAMYDLNEFVDPKNFKSYDELKKQVDRCFRMVSTDEDPSGFESPARSTVSAPASSVTRAAVSSPAPEKAPWEVDETPTKARSSSFLDDTISDTDALINSLNDEI